MNSELFGAADVIPHREKPLRRNSHAKYESGAAANTSGSSGTARSRLPRTEGRLGTGDSARLQRRVFGLNFSPDTMDELVEAITNSKSSQPGVRIVATANLDHIVTLRSNPAFRAAYRQAWRVTADGTPVYLYARAVGLELQERVTGSDLFAILMDRWRPADHRLFLLVSNEGTGRKITKQLADRGFDASSVRFEVPPFGFEKDEAYSHALAEQIADFGPTHLIMGVGAPKSEIWANHHQARLGDVIVLCVGASIEFLTGEKYRSPMLLRKLGMEWLWRFAMEPRRLFFRYFVRSFAFVKAVIADQRSEGSRC